MERSEKPLNTDYLVKRDLIRAERERLELTIAACAERAGMGATRWRSIENGRWTNIRVLALVQVCRALPELTPDQLLNIAGDEPPAELGPRPRSGHRDRDARAGFPAPREKRQRETAHA